MLAILPLVAFGRTLSVPPLPPSEFADTEVSTNIVIGARLQRLERLRFVLELAPTATNGTKDLDVFFTHGFNVNAEDARAWGAEVFKRFWQSGSNANFHMLPWRGDYRLIDQSDLTTDLSALHYQHNAWFAQRTGGALKRYVEAAQPVAAKRVLMTQSLGNMVACEALREGLQVGQYYMFDAAIPSEAIDETLRAETRDDEAFAKYVPSAWHDYTNASWAANWHQFFKNDPNDARGKMGWANRFQDALTNATEVFNYYSSGDEVFHETANPPWLLAGLDMVAFRHEGYGILLCL